MANTDRTKTTRPDPDAAKNAARIQELAKHRALLAQQEKQLRLAIINSTCDLVDFPHRTKFAAQPDRTDVEQVKSYLSIFGEVDYDELIEERNVYDKCGYVLCPGKTNDLLPHSRSRRFSEAEPRASKPYIVRAARWCSLNCAERASELYLQLRDTPVAKRSLRRDGGLRLHRESELKYLFQHAELDALADNLGSLGMPQGDESVKVRDVDELAEMIQMLAVERGEKGGTFRSQMLSSKVVEKQTGNKKPVPPMLSQDTVLYDAVEGFTPQQVQRKSDGPIQSGTWNRKGDILDNL